MFLFFIEPAHADSWPKKTVAETVNSAAKYLVDLNQHTSLVTLKKYLISECGEVYVIRNTERIKTEVKEMFKNNVIYPAHRSKTNKPPTVTVQFKFRAVKAPKRRLSVVEKKMAEKQKAQKKAKATTAKGKKNE